MAVYRIANGSSLNSLLVGIVWAKARKTVGGDCVSTDKGKSYSMLDCEERKSSRCVESGSLLERRKRRAEVIVILRTER